MIGIGYWVVLGVFTVVGMLVSNRLKSKFAHYSKIGTRSGMSGKEIAEAMFISTETVRKHVYHVYEKLHVTNRIEAVNKFFGR